MLLLITVLQTTGCYRIYHKSKLTLQKEPFDRQKITFRTDGYYYLETLGDNYVTVQGYPQRLPDPVVVVQPIFFYADGYVHYVHARFAPISRDTFLTKAEQLASALLHVEDYIRRGPVQIFKKNPRYTVWNWGLYRQSGDNLKIQYYFNALGDYWLINLDAAVVNDSTLRITNQSSYVRRPPPFINRVRDDLYTFRKYNLKPDSATYLRDRIDRFGK